MPLSEITTAFPAFWDAAMTHRITFAPTVLFAIFTVHVIYFFVHRKRCGQQEIALQDLSAIRRSEAVPAAGLVVVRASCVEFDAATRSTIDVNLALPQRGIQKSKRRPIRLQGAQSFRDVEVRQTLICTDDVTVSGQTVFMRTLKVVGDLRIEGQAVFYLPVVVSGVLQVNGTAHFAAGVVCKGDTLVRGALTIGSNTHPGWAVVRELALERRLALNGTLVTGRAVEIRAAA